MAIPALIIGLGGTGQWVLTYLKKELLNYTNREHIPEEVRLLAFDTTRVIEEEAITLTGVSLDVSEFYRLRGNIEKVVREVAEENMHPHISSWLQAKTYINRLSAGQYLLEEGVGNMRPFGRMALFKDLEANPESSKVMGTIRNAIHDIRSNIKEDRTLQIYIIASLAGGTGAGMVIDVAHIARTIAEDTIGSKNFVINGFFVLPGAFHLIPGGDTIEMRARAFAALRELSRFITVFGDWEYPMMYNRHPQFKEILQKPAKKRIFDLCYLVDAHRERNSLDDVEPKFGIFPSIADAVLTFLDEKSGQEHTGRIRNMMPHLTRGDDIAYFSAAGTYSFVFPIREITEENTCKLAIEFLDRLVIPEWDGERRVTGLSSSHNQEMPGKRGSDLVEHFMEKPEGIRGIRGTPFLSRAAKLLEQGGISNNRLLEQVANQNYMEWLIYIEPDDETQDIRDLRQEFHSTLKYSLGKYVKTSRDLNEKPGSGYERIEKEIESFLLEYLGEEHPEGESTIRGILREGLDRYVSLQIQRFQTMLGRYCIQLLNGMTDTRPEVSKSGKLGFVQDFLDMLSRKIEEFCKFMEQIKQVRLQQGQWLLKKREVQEARDQMFEFHRKKRSFFLLRDDSYDLQKKYLMLREEQLELEKNDLVFDYVNQAAKQHLEHILALKRSMDKWANTLVIGSDEQPGLYQELNKFLKRVQAIRQSSKSFSRIREEEINDQFELKLYQRYADQQLNDMFREAEWTLSKDSKTVTLEVFGHELRCNRTRKEHPPAGHNLEVMLEKNRWNFQRLIKDQAIGCRLMDRYNVDELAHKFHEKGSPLINFRTEPMFGRPHNLLIVKYGIKEGDEQFFKDVVKRINLQSARNEEVKLAQSEGTHKCVLIHTIDIINADCLTVYEDLFSAYRAFAEDPRLLHNFPAEVNAVYYEQLVHSKLLKAYRIFHPRIVFLLERKEWVLLFTRCLVYDLIKLKTDKDGNQFLCLHLPKCELQGKKYSALVIELTPHKIEKVEFLLAMYTFIFKQKDSRKDSKNSIQYNHLELALKLAEEKVGDAEANIKKLKDSIKSGIIRDFENSTEQFERDLGDLMHVMLLDQIDRFSAITDQETSSYHMVLITKPKQIAVGQRLTLRVEIRPGSTETNSFELPKDIPELYCFIIADGLQLVSDEVTAIPVDLKNRRPIPVEFELQGHVRGKQNFTVELFIEDQESKRLRIIKSSSQVTVVAPKPTQEPQIILPQIDIRVAPQPDFILQVESNIKSKTGVRYYQVALNYRLTSYLPKLRCKQEKVGEIVLNSIELHYFRTMINQTMGQISNAQPEDIRQRMLSLGTYLFDRLFPPDTTGKFRTMFWKARDQINTWLMIEDVIKNGINWIPWELVVPYGKGEDSPLSFLGERYHLSRWVNGLGTTLYGEFPFGDIALIDYKHLIVSEGEEHSERMGWQRKLNAHKARNLREVVQPETPVYAVHLLRCAEPITRREIVDRDQTDRTEEVSPEEEAQQRAKLDIKLKRPVITFSILNQNSIHSTVTFHDVSLPDRVLPFLRAGASAVICPWWPTTEAADQVFWNTFYDLLERCVPLGEAALRARLSVRDAFPHLADWLAYSVFGDPRARPYWPEDSQGYTALECLSPGKYLLPGKNYSFRVSIGVHPPVGFKGRVVRCTTLPDEVQALFLAPGLQETIPGPVPMVPVNPGGTMLEVTQQFKTPQLPGKYPLLVQFFSGEEHIKTLKLMLNIDYD